jgi:hypothetical protein
MSEGGRELIQIEANEDPNSVKDRLSFYRGQRVLLIWPEEGTALTRKLDLVLVQREAMRRQIRLAFVTHDPEVIKHAAELNISTFQTIGASERKRWARGRTRVFTGRQRRPSDAPTPEDLEADGSRSRGRRRAPSFGSLVFRLVLIGAFLGAAFAVFYFLVPTATVTITPATSTVQSSVQITVNADPAFTDVDIENAVLPASTIRVEIEERTTINTTGTQNLGDVRAVGEVIFINETTDEVEIPDGTTISTSAGTPILFRTTEPASLPGGVGSEVTVNVEAMQSAAGSIGNVEANLINTIVGPLEEQADVLNLQPTRDGQSRQEAAVTANDRDRAEGQVNFLLQQRAYDEMLDLPEIGEDEFVILETLRIVEDLSTTFDAAPGDLAESLSVTKRAVVEAVVVDTTLGQQIVFARMAEQIPRGREFDLDSITYNRGEVSFAGELILFTMSGQGTIIAQINQRSIRNALTNRTIDEALTYLSENVDIQGTPAVVLSPDVFGRLPLWAERITVETVTP